MKATTELLLGWTAARIAADADWTQGCSARTADGVEVDPLADEAARWCVFGSLSWAAKALAAPLPVQAEAARCLGRAAWRADWRGGVPAGATSVNDDLGKAAVDAMLDDARVIAERRRRNGEPGAVLGF